MSPRKPARPSKFYRVTCPFCPPSAPTWFQQTFTSRSEAQELGWEMEKHISLKHPEKHRAYQSVNLALQPKEFVPAIDGYQPKVSA